MISKNELKFYSSLLKKKFRDEENKFIVEGKKIVLEGLESIFKCDAIILTHEFYESNEELIPVINSFDVRLEIIKKQEFSKIADTQTPQGIAAIFTKPPVENNKVQNVTSKLIACLENISDPGNVGTIIRNCDWFGVNEIMLDNTCADVYNPKTIRSAMGSIFHINIYNGIDLYTTIPALKKKGYEVLCADLEGENIFGFQDTGKSVLILANEANGPSLQALSLTDKKITIPKMGKAESLNVANASAIILAEMTK